MQYGSPQQSVHLLPPRTSCAHVVVALCVLRPHRRCPARSVLVSLLPRVFCARVIVAPRVLCPRRRRPMRPVSTSSSPRASCVHVVVAPCVLCPRRRRPVRPVSTLSPPRAFCTRIVVAPCVLCPHRRRPVRSVPTPSFPRPFCAHVVVVAMKKPTSALKGMDAICRTLISSTGRLPPFLQVSHHHPRRPLPQRPNHHVPARVSYLLREIFLTRFRLLITNCRSPSVHLIQSDDVPHFHPMAREPHTVTIPPRMPHSHGDQQGVLPSFLHLSTHANAGARYHRLPSMARHRT
jgi:hypothetical protein